MELVIRAKLHNIFKAKDFKNKDGQIESKGKWQLQFIDEIEGDEGMQIVVHKVSIPDDKVDVFKSQVGELVEVPVKAFSNKGKVVFYGI